MVEIPDHLKKRAEAAKKKAEEKASSSSDATASKIPAHLLQRSKSAKGKSVEASKSDVAAPPAAGQAAVASSATASLTGPAGHTQRLLTVVKSGSIQDIKSKPHNKVHTWPHLIVVEFGAMLALTAFLFLAAVFVNAPLLEDANVNQTPNPSKAPWYFLGLQELLTLFHPMVAGVTIPGVGLFALILAPYIDKTVSNKPEDRKLAISLFTFFMMFWAVLSIIGSFFRGAGFNFVFPWIDGIHFEL